MHGDCKICGRGYNTKRPIHSVVTDPIAQILCALQWQFEISHVSVARWCTWCYSKGVDSQAAQLLHQGSGRQQVDIGGGRQRWYGLQQYLELASLQLQLLSPSGKLSASINADDCAET